MAAHIMSLTYKSKINDVQAGKCRQTIRTHKENPCKHVGDKIILHTWSGKPYRSPWGWRYESKIESLAVLFYSDGVWHMADSEGMFHPCESAVMDEIAKADGIFPPTKERLEATLKELNGLKTLDMTFWDVIGWQFHLPIDSGRPSQ
ncbi:MAG TPA: hypothetical protein VGK23_02320 [Methanomassiliicoccales archaeon]